MLFPFCTIWQYGLWSFQMGDTKLERFLPKNQHTQGNYWISRIELMGASEVFKNQSFKSQLISSSHLSSCPRSYWMALTELTVCNLKINIKNNHNLHWPQCLLLHEDCHNISWLVPIDLWLAFFWWFPYLQLWYIVPIFSDCLQLLQWNHYRAAYQSIFASAVSRRNQ